jgi:hypothetical protein
MKTDMTDQEIDALAERVTRALDVPEPSPLFWDHFPARVRAAVSTEAPAAAPAWWRRPVAGLSLAVALCAALAVWVMVPRMGTAPAAPAVGTVVSAEAGVDDAWALVSSAAEIAGPDALRDAGFGVQPSGADAAIEDLTQDERAAFVALLQAEMKGGGAGGL